MFNYGQFTMFDDPNSVMDPVVSVLAKAVNLGVNKGAFFNSLGAPQAAITQEKFEIFSRSKSTRDTTVGTGGWLDGTTTTALPVASTGVAGLTVGCVLQAESEITIVKSVDRSANTIDVFGRGLGGTTGAAHAADVVIKVIGYAAKPTDLKNVESMSESTIVYQNYVQTIYEMIDYTRRAQQLRRRGVAEGNIVMILQQEAMNRVAGNLSVMSVLGVKQLGTADIPYMTAGLFAQLADDVSGSRPVLSVDAKSAALSETILRGALQEVFANGSPDTIWVSAKNKEVINNFNDAASTVQVTRDANQTVAGLNVDTYNYEGKLLRVRVDTDVPDTKLAIVNSSKCYKGWLIDDGIRIVDEPSASSEEKKQSIKGAVGIAIEDVGYEHSYIYNLG